MLGMDIFSIVFIAVGLAMDCFAVAISKGICARRYYWRYALRMGLLFGAFQALMPLIGFFISSSFAAQIRLIDHWIALILLAFLGVRMIIGAFEEDEDCQDSVVAHFKWRGLLTLAIATSIDALAAGVIFAPFPESIWMAVLIIGCASFLFSVAGMFIGAHFGNRFHFKVEVPGGIILIAIGIKIWIEHMFF